MPAAAPSTNRLNGHPRPCRSEDKRRKRTFGAVSVRWQTVLSEMSLPPWLLWPIGRLLSNCVCKASAMQSICRQEQQAGAGLLRNAIKLFLGANVDALALEHQRTAERLQLVASQLLVFPSRLQDHRRPV